MVEHIGLVIAEIAYRVLPIMRVVELEIHQIRQSIQVKDLSKTEDLVPREVKLLKRDQTIHGVLDVLDFVTGD